VARGKAAGADLAAMVSGGDLGGYVLEAQIGHVLRRAHQRATQIFMAELGDRFQMTPTQYAALIKLYELGEQSQNRLGRLTAMDPATIQGVVKRLEERHLVERSGDPEDRRRSTLRVTAAGAVLAREMLPFGRRVTEVTLERLSPGERAEFLAHLQRLA
jgi:DNA-binding MarR family transcriptional regulator